MAVNKCSNSTSPGQPCVVGSLQPIVATSGDDVVLPCHLEPSQSVEEAVVEWSRQEPGHVQYVHVYRDHGEVTDMKTASYHRRTALFTEELRRGNISLKITDVSPADEGSYRCFVPTLRSPAKDSTVRLIVGECGKLFCSGEAAVDPVSGHWRSSVLVIVWVFFLEPNLRRATAFPTVPPTVDPQSPTTDEGGRAHLAVIVPFVLVPVILVAGAAFFWKFCQRNR